jgi:hypothetical protein
MPPSSTTRCSATIFDSPFTPMSAKDATAFKTEWYGEPVSVPLASFYQSSSICTVIPASSMASAVLTRVT